MAEDKKDGPEELDLGAGSSIPKPAQPEHPAENEHPIEAHTPDMHEALNPQMTDEQVLDQILQIPQESLIPWEDCMLPSQGFYYDWPDGMIQVRPMGQKAEKILATQRLASSGQSIDYLFTECCKFPEGFSAGDLLLGDRVFLLYFLRGITHGNMYEFVVGCPNPDCGASNTHTYDLNMLAETITPAKPELGKEPFKVSLPYLSGSMGRNIWVELRFLRAYDANDMLARRKVKKKAVRPGSARNRSVDPRQQQDRQVMLDDTLDENLEKVIYSAMGDTDPMKIRGLVQRMHARDTSTIRDWLRDNTPGIDNSINIECPSCGGEFTVELPITESFFRSSN